MVFKASAGPLTFDPSPSDPGTRSVPRLLLAVPSGAEHPSAAQEPRGGATSQSHEGAHVSTVSGLAHSDLCDLSVTSAAAVCVLRFVLKELIQTEKDYVKDLGIVVEVGNTMAAFVSDQSETATVRPSAGFRCGTELCPYGRAT